MASAARVLRREVFTAGHLVCGEARSVTGNQQVNARGTYHIMSYIYIYLAYTHTHRDRWMDTQIGLQVHGQTYIDVRRFVGCKGRYSAYIQRHACRSMYLQSAGESRKLFILKALPEAPNPEPGRRNPKSGLQSPAPHGTSRT